MKYYLARIIDRCLASAMVLTVASLFVYAPAIYAVDEEHEGHEHDSIPGHAHDLTNTWNISHGGVLYDKWWAVVMREPPKGTHPAYPASGKKKGSSTWRCKECHGWDSMGKDGAYSKGSHYTGIKGIRAMANADRETIHNIIMDDTHRYTEEMLSHEAMEKISLFVSQGQIDMDRYIDRATKKSLGDAQRGAAAFQTICAVCHGFEGKRMNFKTPEKPEYIGTVAQKNPWEFMHKARYGQPGVPMISLITLPIEAIADILAYAQTLPAK
jgi:thiosulfate dehydrogenase